MNDHPNTMPALLTYDDYCQIPDDGKRYEVINGVLYMSPSPIVRHQRISGNLYGHLWTWSNKTGVAQILIAPMDVVLSEHNVVQPDILFISDARTSIIDDKNIQGPPDLLIEVISEGNRRHDEVRKRTLYESFGVLEYWIVDPVLETIKVYRLVSEQYVRAAEWMLENEDHISSPLLPGFDVKLVDVFGL